MLSLRLARCPFTQLPIPLSIIIISIVTIHLYLSFVSLRSHLSSCPSTLTRLQTSPAPCRQSIYRRSQSVFSSHCITYDPVHMRTLVREGRLSCYESTFSQPMDIPILAVVRSPVSPVNHPYCCCCCRCAVYLTSSFVLCGVLVLRGLSHHRVIRPSSVAMQERGQHKRLLSLFPADYH